MACPKMRVELLTSRYVKENSVNLIPIDITNLIQLFYNQYFYWKLTKNEITQFRQAELRDIIYSPSKFTIQGIEFELTLCPNGWTKRSNGDIELFIEVKKMPSNIVYFIFYGHVGCDLTSTNNKFLSRFKNGKNAQGTTIGKFADCQHMENMEFYCMVDILGIKYNFKSDYKTMLKLSKHIKYEWKIDDKSQMEKIKNLKIPNHGLYSNTFDNDNWCIALHPGGFKRNNDGDFEIRLYLLK